MKKIYPKPLKTGVHASAHLPVPLMTGATPATVIKSMREEKADRSLLQMYIDDFHWYASVNSRRLHQSSTLAAWKLASLGGMGAQW